MKEQLISIKDFHYDLPFERIAKYPLPERDASKLAIYKNGNITESTYNHLDGFLPTDSILFFNNTKVIPARLFFKTTTDKTIEIFCLEAATNTTDVYGEMLKTNNTRWKCIVGGVAKWKEQFIYLTTNEIKIKAQLIERLNDSFIIEFSWEPGDKSFSEVLQMAGAIPIPPYLKRSSETVDSLRYQTLYAKNEGSVAAPTAGLHFTKSLMQKLAAKNILPHYITLHVGAGTFKPVKAESMADHEMHREFIEVSLSVIETILLGKNKTIGAVGTTSSRTIESLYWLGVKTYLDPNIKSEELIVNQWDPYQLNQHQIKVQDALQSLYSYLIKHQLNSLYTQTSLLIVPGYDFKIINLLVTNFHQPESTLILLVAAFIGEDWRKVYQYALDHEFRFLSYGDGCLLFKNNNGNT
jgi:S-adenosylmethionine:tRNA ribosyltransferase-isomerase